jgi:hypothetical protein
MSRTFVMRRSGTSCQAPEATAQRHRFALIANVAEPAIGDIPSPSFWDTRLVDLCGLCSWHNAPRAGNMRYLVRE